MANCLKSIHFDHFISLPKMLRNFAKLFHFLGSNDSTNVSDNLSMEKLIDNIKEKKYDHIIFMVGAGISTCKFHFCF